MIAIDELEEHTSPSISILISFLDHSRERIRDTEPPMSKRSSGLLPASNPSSFESLSDNENGKEDLLAFMASH